MQKTIKQIPYQLILIQLFYIEIVRLQQIGNSEQFTYYDHLDCITRDCNDSEFECNKDNSCYVMWFQFQKCYKNSFHPEGYLKCKTIYSEVNDNSEKFSPLLTCFENCQGHLTHQCKLQLDEYDKCKYDYDHISQFEKNVKLCLFDEKCMYSSYSQQEQKKCIDLKTYNCMNSSKDYSECIKSMLDCKLTKLQKSSSHRLYIYLLLQLLLIIIA